MPPDSNGSGASPAEPDQPTQAPPRPATKGSSAVTSPPGLRCQRVLAVGVGDLVDRQPVGDDDDGAVRPDLFILGSRHTAADPTERDARPRVSSRPARRRMPPAAAPMPEHERRRPGRPRACRPAAASRSRTTSAPKVEKVVSVPQKPVPTRATTAAGTSARPSSDAEQGAAGDVDDQRAQRRGRAPSRAASRSASSRSGAPASAPSDHEQRRHAAAPSDRPRRPALPRGHRGHAPGDRDDARTGRRRPAAPASARWTTSTAKAEYVVYPPRTPDGEERPQPGRRRGAGRRAPRGGRRAAGSR